MYQGPCQHGPGNVTRQRNEGNLLDEGESNPVNLSEEVFRGRYLRQREKGVSKRSYRRVANAAVERTRLKPWPLTEPKIPGL
jgi:hypothetical protein